MRAGSIALVLFVLSIGCTSSGRDDRGRGRDLDAGPFPTFDSGPFPATDTGPFPTTDTGPISTTDTGPAPTADAGPPIRTDTGPGPAADTGPTPTPDAGPPPAPDAGPPPATRCFSTRDSCDDGDPCTTQRCDVYAQLCHYETVPRCCRSSAECTVAGRCMTPICRTTCGAYETGSGGCCTADTDCDDGDPCTRDSCFASPFPGFDSICQNDRVGDDRDGDFALARDAVRGCGTDCHDGNAGVNPGIRTFSTTPYVATDGTSTFDFDCDGVESPEWDAITNTAACRLSSTPGKYCVATSGWTERIAACGVTAPWRRCIYDIRTPPHCFESFEMRTQACR